MQPQNMNNFKAKSNFSIFKNIKKDFSKTEYYFYKSVLRLDYIKLNVGEVLNEEVPIPTYKTKKGTNKIIDYDKIEVKVDSAIKYTENQ